ncbi:MAG: hypothetical protein ACFCVH_15145 [Alphaproteobacteria bacterium]
MIYIIGQIWIWLAVALALGALIGWLWARIGFGGRVEAQVAPFRERVAALERERETLRRELGEASDRATEREAQLSALRGDLQAQQPGSPLPAEDEPVATALEAPSAADKSGDITDPGVTDPGGTDPGVTNPREVDPVPNAPPPVDEPERIGTVAEDARHAALAGDPGLTRIKGIGKAVEARLKQLDITSCAQIATLTDADVERIDAALGFKGRVARERWVEQARALLEPPTEAGPG